MLVYPERMRTTSTLAALSTAVAFGLMVTPVSAQESPTPPAPQGPATQDQTSATAAPSHDAAPPSPTSPPASAAARARVAAFITGGLAIVTAGVGVGLGLSALSQAQDFKASPTVQKADAGENTVLATDMLFGAALTFGITSAVLFLTSNTADTAKATPVQRTVRVTPAPYVTSSGGGASAVVTF